MHHLELSAFPEELLERILALSVVAPLVQTARPQWHQRSDPNVVRGRLAPLLVCKKFFRICTPLFYHTIHITSPAQLHSLLSIALRPNVYLATYIHRLFFAGIWAEGGELLSMCGNNIKMLDITLDVTQLAPGVYAHRDIRDLDAEDFCDGLKDITSSLTHLVLRKSHNVYLTQPKPRHVLGEIAKAMRHWDNLDLADIAFRLSDDSGLGSSALIQQQSPQVNSPEIPEGPITSLTHALITRPKLRTFCTLLPSLWNETILRISSNPNLECIVLGDGTYRHARSTSLYFDNGPAFDAGSGGIVGTGLFLTQAKKHARLSDLIRAGTSIMRTRAQTLGTPSSSSSSPSSSRARPPASSHVNYARSQSMIPTSTGSSPSSSNASSAVSTSTLSTSQKYQQRQGDGQSQNRVRNQQQHHHHHHHHQQNASKYDSTNLSRVTGSGASKPLSRSLMSQAV